MGEGSEAAAAALARGSWALSSLELGSFAPARWAEALGPLLAQFAVVVVAASPDGRDLAPRLAWSTGRALHASAVALGPDSVLRLVRDGRVEEEHLLVRPSVVALLPGSGAPGWAPAGSPAGNTWIGAPEVGAPEVGAPEARDRQARDPELLAVLAPDPASARLAEAGRV
ncbi:MAG: hypothetical protein ACRDYD_14205, partial [Acidimicrobiales bacterium]